MHLHRNIKAMMIKKKSLLPGISALLAALFILSCTKEGPEGPPGADGDDGIQTCYNCHNMNEDLVTVATQYENSIHGIGANINRNYTPCNTCHTSMGFRHSLNDSLPDVVDNPTPINCRTCHKIHETYSFEDYTLRTTDSLKLDFSGEIYDYGKSNLCANCHHARMVNPYPVLGGSDVTITNSHYGPHHAPQSDILLGAGGIEIEGSQPYINSAHTNLVKDGCVTCHMATASGMNAGGHQMNIKYTGSRGSTEYEFSGCYSSACHKTEDAVTALIEPNRIMIDSLLTDLHDSLISVGVLKSSGSLNTPLTITAEQAAAFINYELVAEDKSLGTHNFKYSRALLINSIEALDK